MANKGIEDDMRELVWQTFLQTLQEEGKSFNPKLVPTLIDLLPQLLLPGEQSTAIKRAGVEMTKQYMKGEYSLLELDAGHALLQEKFERVNHEILNHIQRHSIKD